MTIQINGRIGLILFWIWAIVTGLSMALGFALPPVLMGVWLVVAAVLALVGV